MARRRKSNARVPLNTYVLRDLRAWLTARAEEGGDRSLSQYVERVLDEHRRAVEAARLATSPSNDHPKSEGTLDASRT